MRPISGCLLLSRAAVSLLLFSLPLLLHAVPADALAEEEAAGVEEATFGSALGQEQADSVRIFFTGGESFYNPDLRNNKAVLSGYISRIKHLESEGRLRSIVVEGYVSPDGTTAINERLAGERSRVLADIIAQQAGVGREKIRTIAGGINWSELRRLIESRPDVPSRAALLEIIDNTPVWIYDKQGKIIGGRKKSLMDLQGGHPYLWMYDHLFPQMRNAVAISLSVNSLPARVEPLQADSLSGVDAAQPDTINQASPASEQPSAEPAATSSEPRIDILALKTNLLYYAILMPNLEAEWMINDRWSVALEAQYAWYAKEPAHKVDRIATLMPEVRYWAMSRSRWHGLYVGVFGGGGLYDLCNSRKGHEGEGGLVGVSAGYVWPIGKHLSLEAGLGLGYMRLRDKVYKPLDGHYLYQLTKNINYFGPLRVKLSLVWRFLSVKKKSGK